ncbi:hypothetical protein [Halomonas maura]|uniref:hypothetical protein n=1 Tax=Halomonas maura TaxID=117606 RepID=UPI0025B3720A|nr:hypothetical protein [Halomonas maura]MDN3557446.1 hypothetical protein [Halomonas maura]
MHAHVMAARNRSFMPFPTRDGQAEVPAPHDPLGVPLRRLFRKHGRRLMKPPGPVCG